MWTLWGPSTLCELWGFYSGVVEDSVTLGYDAGSLVKPFPIFRRNIMYLFSRAHGSQKGNTFTPPGTDYLLKQRHIPEYRIPFLHPFTFLSRRSKYFPQHPVSRTYKAMQTTHVLHFKFLHLCLLFWLTISCNQEKSIGVEFNTFPALFPTYLLEENNTCLSSVVWARRTTLVSEKLPTQHGVSLWPQWKEKRKFLMPLDYI
jgi:hypothetical protein